MLPREQSGTDHGIDADGQFLAGRCLLRGAGNGQEQTVKTSITTSIIQLSGSRTPHHAAHKEPSDVLGKTSSPIG